MKSTLRRYIIYFEGVCALFIRKWTALDARANLIICHGIGEHSGRYDAFAFFLTSRGFNVFSTDLPGHGLHHGQRGYVDSFDDLKNAVVDLAAAVRKERDELPLFLFGHSMGGLIGSRVIEESPNIFRAAVLSSPHLYSAKESVKKLLPVVKLVKKLAPKITFSSSSRFEPSDLSHNKLAVQRYIDDPYVHDRVSPNLFLGMEENIEMAFSEAERITIPTMIIIGSDDRVIDPSGARKFYEVLRSEKRFLEIAGGMHEMFADEERKGILFEGVVSFFSEFL